MNNERILIFGDSYSTYSGYVPEGYAVYYPAENIPDVDGVEKTWWGMLTLETNSKIILNNSWSGSTVCNVGYSGDCSKTNSFIHRLEVLIESGFFAENVLTRVFVFGGTNDSWTGNACGEEQYSNWTQEDLKRVLPGYGYFIHRLLDVVPKEKIHIILNSELRENITDGIINICAHHDITCTRLTDIEKIGGHPTYKGMCAIKDQVLKNDCTPN